MAHSFAVAVLIAALLAYELQAVAATRVDPAAGGGCDLTCTATGGTCSAGSGGRAVCSCAAGYRATVQGDACYPYQECDGSCAARGGICLTMTGKCINCAAPYGPSCGDSSGTTTVTTVTGPGTPPTTAAIGASTITPSQALSPAATTSPTAQLPAASALAGGAAGLNPTHATADQPVNVAGIAAALFDSAQSLTAGRRLLRA
ncbi:hypothetical protein WJX81_002594 [Elliptochloris bilobata]|uniref:EGF-like domain-containing protein n=1 Tax=Elliptochloris bilobata TaxID=381761 RepID=A0AAW1RFI5_9CHLO